MTRQLEILLSEVNGRVAVSRELLAKSGLSQEIINDLDGLFLIIKSFNDIISALRKENEELKNLKICSGCGHLSWNKISDTAIACCPDNNYIPVQDYARNSYYSKLSIMEMQKRIEELEKALRNISGLDSAIDLGLQV